MERRSLFLVSWLRVPSYAAVVICFLAGCHSKNRNLMLTNYIFNLDITAPSSSFPTTSNPLPRHNRSDTVFSGCQDAYIYPAFPYGNVFMYSIILFIVSFPIGFGCFCFVFVVFVFWVCGCLLNNYFYRFFSNTF